MLAHQRLRGHPEADSSLCRARSSRGRPSMYLKQTAHIATPLNLRAVLSLRNIQLQGLRGLRETA